MKSHLVEENYFDVYVAHAGDNACSLTLFSGRGDRRGQMFGKRTLPYNPDSLPPARRLRANIRELFASNTLSGTRVQSLVNDMADAGADGIMDLRRGVSGAHSARFLRGRFMKFNQWPPLYWARVRLKDPRSEAVAAEWLAFLLPHELVETLAKYSDPAQLCYTGGLDAVSLGHYATCREGACTLPMLPLGLWGDGVPVNWDRTESVETLSLNFPGLMGRMRALRIPLTAVSRKQIVPESWHDIMQVVAWSFQHGAAAVRPLARHDGTAWLQPSDSKRAQSAGLKMQVSMCMVQVRADWKWYGEVLHMPKHNTASGLCWKCTCTPEQVFHGVNRSVR